MDAELYEGNVKPAEPQAPENPAAPADDEQAADAPAEGEPQAA